MLYAFTTLLLAPLVLGYVTPNATAILAPCAHVSSAYASQIAASPSATPTVAARLSLECLSSVPLHKPEALDLVESMEPYLQWQTDSAYLADPPSTYFYPPHNLFTFLADVKTKLENGTYANEYEFQVDLYQLFARAHNGHFILYPDALTKAFQWGRLRSLVSVSEDGVSIPVIKLYEDIIAGNKNAPVVTKINGLDAATYVADFAYTASFNQDPDAAYNTMFYEKAFEASETGTGYFSGGGRVRYIYPGDNTTFTFSNGTTFTLENIAYVKASFAGVVDGESFYQEFCTGPTPGADSGAGSGASTATETAAGIINPGYPAPVIITGDGVVSGYYLTGGEFSDVAVLSLLGFENESPLEFQTVCQEFFASAVAAGKTKLVIDVSANGGGYILQGYDLFRQLFPHIVQDGYNRWRENPSFLALSDVFSAVIPKNYNPDTASAELIEFYENSFNWRYDYDFTDEPFTSFEDKFAPHVYKGDNFTSLLRWNPNDPLTTSNSTFGLGIDITGYGSRQNFTQPFLAENIIILQDGYCASTCTLFTEFLRLQAGVKNIAMGGRPKPGPIQGVGGVKGAEILGWSDIYNYAQQALPFASPEQAQILNSISLLPNNRSSANGINVRDNILPGNVNDGVPAQFVVEEADCRLFYTESMVTDVTELWKAAAVAAFQGGRCVSGGLQKRSVEVEGRGEEERARKAEAIRRNPIFARDSRVERSASWIARQGRKVIE